MPVKCAACECRSDQHLHWIESFLHGGSTGSELMHTECARCLVERESRARVIPRQGEEDAEKKRLDRIQEEAKTEPFVEAPAIYAYNVPKWSTLLLRAREYAKQILQCLCWSFAHEVHPFSDDREPPVCTKSDAIRFSVTTRTLAT